MVARAPAANTVERPHLNPVGNVLRCEDEVELASRRFRSLPRVVESRNVSAVRRQFRWPRCCLAPVWGSWTEESEAHRGRTVEDRLVPRSKVGVPVFPIAKQDVEVACDQEPLTSAAGDKA